MRSHWFCWGTCLVGLQLTAAFYASAQTNTNLSTKGAITESLPLPPPMSRRSISPSSSAPGGQSVLLDDKGFKFTLFIPTRWSATEHGATALTAHFHTVAWFVIQEHLRRGSKDPLVCFALGEGSTVYRQPFEDTNRFGRIILAVEQELQQRAARTNIRITGIDVSSFSAGYGAVRELIKSPEYFRKIRRVVLLDSMYAAFEEGSTNRTPAKQQIEVWVPLAQAAIRGEKTFLFTHSAVPTEKYANSSECAVALLNLLGISRQSLTSGSLPATLDPDFPLRFRSDSGRFHVWGYDGQDAQAHMTHARHMADVWQALETRP